MIETKWSADTWTLEAAIDDRVRRAVERTSAHTKDIHRMVPNHIDWATMITVVVLWGGDNPDDVPFRVIDGVTVVRGSGLRGWFEARCRGRDPHDQSTGSRLANARTDRAKDRDPYDLDTDEHLREHRASGPCSREV